MSCSLSRLSFFFLDLDLDLLELLFFFSPLARPRTMQRRSRRRDSGDRLLGGHRKPACASVRERMEKKEKTQSSKKKKNAFLFSLSSVFSLFASTYTLQFDLSLLFCPEVVTVKEEEVLFVVVLSPSKVNINQSTCREEGGGCFLCFFLSGKEEGKKKHVLFYSTYLKRGMSARARGATRRHPVLAIV